MSIDLGPRCLRAAGMNVARVTAKLLLARARARASYGLSQTELPLTPAVGAHAKKRLVSLQGTMGFLGFDGFTSGNVRFPGTISIGIPGLRGWVSCGRSLVAEPTLYAPLTCSCALLHLCLYIPACCARADAYPCAPRNFSHNPASFCALALAHYCQVQNDPVHPRDPASSCAFQRAHTTAHSRQVLRTAVRCYKLQRTPGAFLRSRRTPVRPYSHLHTPVYFYTGLHMRARAHVLLHARVRA